jgi:endonuclease YncB( thermonuclease family)
MQMVPAPLIRAVAFLGGLLVAVPALADPCEAPLPRPGATFSGTVRYLVDGDGLCVGNGPDPATWIEVRLADFYAPELHEPGGAQAKAALERVTAGRRLVCTADHRSWDRIVAVCTIGRKSVGELMHEAGVPEGGRGR